LSFAFTAGLVCAQSTLQLEIRGTVVEGGVGVAGVTVTLFQFGTDAAHETTRNVFATTATDSKGAFVIHPARTGEYYLEVNKEGYFAESFDGPAADPMDSTGDPVSLDPDHPSQERRFSLMRLGELRGRVIDDDGKPLPKVNVTVQGSTSSPYRAVARVVTDQNGDFAATRLRPGDYLVRIGPQHGSLEILPQVSEADLKAVDQDLETSFWPGGSEERGASPLPVRPGTSVNVGAITARKATYFRAHLSVIASDCAAGEKWTFSTIPDTAALGLTVPCSKEFLVRNLTPGSYSFTLSRGRPGETKEWATAPVEVTDHNLEVALTMSPGADIRGRIIGAEGVTLPPLAKTMVVVASLPVRLGMGGTGADPAGTFRIFSAPGDRGRISVIGLADQFYIKEIRYNDLVVPDGIITPIAGAPTVMEIVVDDNAAAIRGSVAELDKVTGRVSVVAVKWPMPPEISSMPNLLITSANGVADEQGRFRIGGLAPGEYHVFALTEDLRRRLGADELARLLNRAEKVTVERGSSQSVSLKIVEP
jgi:hypothetical protein